jgi:hypothetical protein
LSSLRMARAGVKKAIMLSRRISVTLGWRGILGRWVVQKVGSSLTHPL